MKFQNNDFDSYVYILYYQSNIYTIFLHPNRLIFLIFKIRYYLTEVLEQPGHIIIEELNDMAIRDKRQ